MSALPQEKPKDSFDDSFLEYNDCGSRYPIKEYDSMTESSVSQSLYKKYLEDKTIANLKNKKGVFIK